MKTKWIVSVLSFFAAANLFATTNDLSTFLQRGLLEEEANHNLDAAISAYQSAVAQFDKERPLAATAIFRLGESYRKQSKTNEANAQYERVVREFPEQTQLAELSRKYVVAKTGEQIANAQQSVGATDEETKIIRGLQRMLKDSPDLVNAHGGQFLHEAASNGRLAVARFLLDNGADVNVPDGYGETPLRHAVQGGHKTMVELLLARGASVNAKNKEGYTALHSGAETGFKSIVEVLLANNAEVNAKGSLGTPLHLAARHDFLSIAQLLIAHKADVDAKDNNDRTPIHSAVEGDHVEMVQLLLTNKADVNATAKGGWTPLLSAVEHGNLGMAKLLLEHGANVEAALGEDLFVGGGNNEYYNCRPLHLAILKINDEMVKLLLESHANPNVKFDWHFSPNFPVARGWTPLLLAIDRQREQAVELLLDHGANPDAINDEGIAPLHHAMSSNSGKTKLVELLLAHQTNLEARTREGRTPLLLAVLYNKDPKMVELLLSHHADVNAPDKSGNPPIAYAKDKSEIAELLRRAGADENFARMRWISVARKGQDFTDQVFFNSTNSLNHYTLFELIAIHYGNNRSHSVSTGHGGTTMAVSSTFPFPDFAHISISRLRAKGEQHITVDLDLAFRTGDCSVNLPLEFGDVVEIPEADHALTDNWTGLPAPTRDVLNKCLERHVEIVVKGKTTKVRLLPPVSVFSPVSSSFEQNLARIRATSPSILPEKGEKAETTVLTFWLNPVLRGANVLLASSDLSRVKIKRTDPATKKITEFIFNSAVNIGTSSGSNTDLWLEDGDVIEVPERDPNAPAPQAASQLPGMPGQPQIAPLPLPPGVMRIIPQ